MNLAFIVAGVLLVGICSGCLYRNKSSSSGGGIFGTFRRISDARDKFLDDKDRQREAKERRKEERYRRKEDAYYRKLENKRRKHSVYRGPNQRPYGRNSYCYDRNRYDRDSYGYNRNSYNRNSYDRDSYGYNRNFYNRNSYDRDSYGYDRNGYGRGSYGYSRNSYGDYSYDRDVYNRTPSNGKYYEEEYYEKSLGEKLSDSVNKVKGAYNTVKYGTIAAKETASHVVDKTKDLATVTAINSEIAGRKIGKGIKSTAKVSKSVFKRASSLCKKGLDIMSSDFKRNKNIDNNTGHEQQNEKQQQESVKPNKCVDKDINTENMNTFKD